MIKRFVSASVAVLLTLSLSAGATAATTVVTEPAREAIAIPTPAPAQPGNEPQPVAEPRITAEQAIERVREYFDVPAETEKLDIETHLSSQGATPIWDVGVTIREGNGSSGFSLAAVDALTGRLLRYHGMGMLPTAVRSGPLTDVKPEEAARERAWALVQKMVPERAADLLPILPDSPFYSRLAAYPYYSEFGAADAYQFTWMEQSGGIPYPTGSVTVSVHKQTLAYLSLNIHLQDGIKFQPGPAKVTVEEAMKVWQSDMKPTLVYQPFMGGYPYGSSKVAAFKLLYIFGQSGRLVDATTGKWAAEGIMPPQPDQMPGEPELVPAGDVKPVVPESLPVTDAAGRKLALAILDLQDTADLRAENEYFGGEEKLLRYSFYDQKSFASVMIEPRTGLIRQANRQAGSGLMEPETAAQTVTPEQEAQAKAAALAVVQTYYSQIREQLRLESVPDYFGPKDPFNRQFRFSRVVNGLAVPNDSIYVTINLQTMQWRDMYANWTNGVAFPDPTGAIAPEKALATFMADRKPVLIYRPVYPTMDPNQPIYRMPDPTEAVLAYVLAPAINFNMIDALTGDAVGWEGMPMADLEAAYKSVTGHWAEGELQFILARRIIRADQLGPDKPLTRSQAIAMILTRNRNGYMGGYGAQDLPFTDVDEDHLSYGAIKMAWVEGWLKPLNDEKAFRPDAPVTRAEFAVWAARALGLGDLARSAIEVKSGFTDLGALTAEQRNAVTFLQALGLLGSAEKFRGDDPMTQAEGAVLTARVYNFFQVK